MGLEDTGEKGENHCQMKKNQQSHQSEDSHLSANVIWFGWIGNGIHSETACEDAIKKKNLNELKVS